MVHFRADLHNRHLLERALAERRLSDAEVAEIVALYESVFHHRSFTGRSGAFYKYEGLGCIYWHMVSKLLLAVQEVLASVGQDPGEAAVAERLRRQYAGIRDGLGVHKTPEVYGAMPLDPYSHTPSFAGAQQPGMTGQVKEDLIIRLGEMGVRVEEGRLIFQPQTGHPRGVPVGGADLPIHRRRWPGGQPPSRARDAWPSPPARSRWSRIGRGRRGSSSLRARGPLE